jgi:hypothetical protein
MTLAVVPTPPPSVLGVRGAFEQRFSATQLHLACVTIAVRRDGLLEQLASPKTAAYQVHTVSGRSQPGDAQPSIRRQRARAQRQGPPARRRT